MNLPERLRQMGNRLAREDRPLDGRLKAYLLEAREILANLALGDLLAGALGKQGAAWAQDEMSGHLHVGFVAPSATPLDLLGRVAAECGFGAKQARFGSEILARELAWLLQRPEVPTMILKADAAPAGQRVLSVEAFIPTVESAISRRWIEEGVGVHLAVGLRHPQSVERALDLCLAHGFQPPAFLHGKPALNVLNEIRVIYVDGDSSDGPLRWEFYHSASETPVGLDCGEPAR